MESERQEIFWAVADVQAFLNAVEVVLNAYETMQNEETEAQNAVDSLLQSLGIAKFP